MCSGKKGELGAVAALAAVVMGCGCAQLSMRKQAEFEHERRASNSDPGVPGTGGGVGPPAIVQNSTGKPGAAPPSDAVTMLTALAETQEDVPLDQRVVIYAASLHVSVKDGRVAVEKARKAAEDAGGYVQKADNDSLQLRVPAKRFREVLNALELLGVVRDRKIEATDVTDEYVDLEMRIRQAEAVHGRLLKLLDRAEDVKAILAIEKELARVTGELERMKAKMARMRGRVTYSTIAVKFDSWSGRSSGRITPGMRAPFYWIRSLDLQVLLGS